MSLPRVPTEFTRSFQRIIQALGGRGPLFSKPTLSGILLVSPLIDSMHQHFQTNSATLTATAINTASLPIVIEEEGFYDVQVEVGNLNAHAAGVRWSLRLRDESDTVIWFQTGVLGTAIGDNLRLPSVRLHLHLNWDLVLFNGDALGVGESVFASIVLTHRLAE